MAVLLMLLSFITPTQFNKFITKCCRFIGLLLPKLIRNYRSDDIYTSDMYSVCTYEYTYIFVMKGNHAMVRFFSEIYADITDLDLSIYINHRKILCVINIIETKFKAYIENNDFKLVRVRTCGVLTARAIFSCNRRFCVNYSGDMMGHKTEFVVLGYHAIRYKLSILHQIPDCNN